MTDESLFHGLKSREEIERELGIVHRNDVPWYEAPKPRRWHRCTVWTKGTVNSGTKVFRCACGAIAMQYPQYWIERNSR